MRFKFLIHAVSWSVLFLSGFSGLTAAAEPSANQELINLVRGLQEQMTQLKGTIEKQDAKIRQLEIRGPEIQMAQPSQTQGEVTPVPMSDYEFNQRLDAATGGAQKWLKDLKFSGDLRLRYEAFANHGTFSDPDRNRFRFRLRYGFEKGFGDQMKVGFSLASGEKVTNNGHNADPTSTNQTMGNLEDFKNIWIEKAYATYKPNWAEIGPISGLELTGGKFTNPFEKGSSDLIFDRDLKPEGAYETAKFKLLDTEDFDLESYFTAGQFILQEGSTVGTDAEMYGFQLGISPTVYVPWMDRPLNFFGAVSYYDYSDFEKS
ncbi:MAG: putative porin, partial [Candidatus Omnitrophica bacterium]|nr:putative porin [Candidatus Omnitrophota bacterium]